MRAHAMDAEEVGEAQRGWALAHAVRARDGSRLFRKGALLDEAVLQRWHEAAPGIVHLLELGPDDVHEDVAGARVAAAVSGDGIRVKGPVQSRYNLISERKGLLRVAAERVKRVNQSEGITLFTLLDRQPVLPGKIVAGVKVTPIAVPEANVAEVERLCAAEGSPLVVLPFVHKTVSVVATEGLNERMRERFRETVQRKIGWYGSEVGEVRFVDSDPDAVAGAMRDFVDDGAQVLMAAGGNTIDPLDPIFLALPRIGGRMVHFGAPSHPGSMFWLAEVDDIPIVSLASCSMYSRATVADLILPLVMTGQQVTSEDIIDLGYGGLLEREMAFRFPDYDAEASDEADSTEE